MGKKNFGKPLMTEKEMLAMELTQIWHIILSQTSNYFWTISKEEENKWCEDFKKNAMRDYTVKQLKEEIIKARKFI